MRILSIVLFSCLMNTSGYGQIVKSKIDLHLGYSRDLSKMPNMAIGFTFNERMAGNGKQKSFNGFVLSATYHILKNIGIKIEATNHFSSGTIQTGIVHQNGAGTVEIAGGDTKYRRASFLGGIQIKQPLVNPRFIPFGHVLAGIHRQSVKIKEGNSDPGQSNATVDLFGSRKFGGSGLAAGLGAGLDVKLNDKINIRAIEFNYILNFIGSKTLSKDSPVYYSSQQTVYQVTREKQQQKQFTVGLGVVYHL